jgi:formiminotetrahydrofolate cyclodeaminase
VASQRYGARGSSPERTLPPPHQAPTIVACNPQGVETLDRYLSQLAAPEPTPGGGSAATLVASTGAALLGMVARICAANPKYAEHRELADRIASSTETLRRDLTAARERDEAAFARVVAAQALPKATEAEAAARARTMESALTGAAAEPLRTASLALDVLRFSAQILAIPNKNLASDVGCAAEFGYAALEACGYNVRVNHRFMKNTDSIAPQAKTLARYEDEGKSLLAVVRRAVNDMLARRTN